jgi:hyperosmotically inducible periplasmic protein
MTRVVRTISLVAAGGVIAALADPASGARRRAMLRDRGVAAGRHALRRLSRLARFEAGKLQGAVAERRHAEAPPADDRTLVDKVRSEAFRGLSVTGHAINVGAVDGVVTLRGQVDDATLRETIASRVAAVAGVRGVENLLHLATEPAPHQGRA